MPSASEIVIAPPPRARWRTALGAVVVLVLVGLGAAVLAAILTPGAPGVEVVGGTGPGSGGGGTVAPSTVVVHVLGAVAAPGLYELPDGARVVDAIAAAGGFADLADRAGVNLARVLVDAEQIRVPLIGEVPPGATGDGLVNLNTADSAQLETLPRVGPAMAERIIAWREEHGGFRTVDDLLAVAGIGEATMAALRPLVSV